MKYMVKVAAITLVFVVAFPVSASTSLYEVYTQALEKDPAIKQQKAILQEKLELKPQASALLMPSVSASVGYSYLNQEESISGTSLVTENDLSRKNLTASISASQALLNIGAFALNRQADNMIEGAHLDSRAAEQSLILRVTKAYLNILAAQDTVEFLESEKKATERQLEQSQKRHEFGQIASTDVYEAKARYDQTEAELIAAKNSLRSTKEALREITGKYYSQLKLLDESMPMKSPQPDSESEWTDIAMKNNPTLLSVSRAVEAAREYVSYQKSGHYPTAYLTASYTKNWNENEYSGIDYDSDNGAGTVGINVTIPIFEGGAVNSRTREASYQYTNAQEQLEEVKRSIFKQIKDAYWGISTNIRRIEALKQTLESAQVALEATETGYEVGTRTIVDVLAAQTLRHSAEKNLKQARYDYLINHLNLKAAAGSLDAEDIKSIDEWLR